jgi:hypothetical protein
MRTVFREVPFAIFTGKFTNPEILRVQICNVSALDVLHFPDLIVVNNYGIYVLIKRNGFPLKISSSGLYFLELGEKTLLCFLYLMNIFPSSEPRSFSNSVQFYIGSILPQKATRVYELSEADVDGWCNSVATKKPEREHV